MNPRERYIKTVLFDDPDRVPFAPGGPRESTLAAWHRQGLPEEANWYAALLDEVGIPPEQTKPQVQPGVSFQMIPAFEEKVLEHRDGHYIVQDWMGAITEISDEFDYTYIRSARDFVTRKWHKFPVETRDDWEAMKERFDPDTPGRFPEDFEQHCAEMADRDYVATIHFNGPFWQLREWCGMEGLCMLMVEQPEFVAEMAAFWTDFMAECMGRIFARTTLDRVGISEDMAYKAHSMISPAMTRRFLQPSYDRWVTMAKRGGCPVVDMDSDGFIGELIPIWIESGINLCDPIEVAAHNDILEFRRQFGRNIAYSGGIDKRALAKGGSIMEEELRRVQPVIEDGGYIPGCDHGVPPDISWPNFIEYAKLLAKMTGWA
jgi:uroporphyrinogen decarboxylase